MVINNNQELSQGIATDVKPYVLNWMTRKDYEVLCNGKRMMWGISNYPKYIQDIVAALNEAYGIGYHKCSVELLNAKGNKDMAFQG